MAPPNVQAPLQRSPTAAAGEPRFTVAVLGAAGGIGQPLALLLKANPAVGELRLYDVVGTPGVGADIGHINTQSKVGPVAVLLSACWSVRCCCNTAWPSFLTCALRQQHPAAFGVPVGHRQEHIATVQFVATNRSYWRMTATKGV
jgi:lactate/malate dehydrogenase, NAD binding domain